MHHFWRVIQLNEKAGTRFREDSDSTERLLSARVNEGFTVEDMIKVVDKKCEEWIGTEFEKYLRPKTLFNASHFEEYINQKNNPAKKKPETKNKFNDFHQREHDWDELEKWALTTKPLVMPRRDNEQNRLNDAPFLAGHSTTIFSTKFY